MISQPKSRTLGAVPYEDFEVEEAGSAVFERLDIKNPYHQVFLARR